MRALACPLEDCVDASPSCGVRVRCSGWVGREGITDYDASATRCAGAAVPFRSALKRWGYGMPFPDAFVYRVVASAFYWTGRTFWRYRLDGLEKVPSEEPFLLLPNRR